jgi:predicted membrane-bound spermidine synthase
MFSDFLAQFTNLQLAFATGLLIFFLTIFLLSRRFIGFSIAAIFLALSLLAGFAIASKEVIHNYNTSREFHPSQVFNENDVQQKVLIQEVENLQMQLNNKTERLQKEIDEIRNNKSVVQPNQP